MPKPLIQVVGSLNIDFVTTTSRFPKPGETLTAKSLDVNAGGKGANQAVGCGRAAFTSKTEQDVDVEMIGAVGQGDPYYASLLRPTLEKSGVSTTKIREIEGVQTGTATIIVDEGAGGENRILFVPGANYHGMNDLNEIYYERMTQTRKPDVVVLQGEIPREVVLGIVELCNKEDATQVVLNPAPVWPEGIPARVLRNMAVLIVNETECLLVTKSMASEGIKIRTVESEEDLSEHILDEIASNFHELVSIQTVVVTLGSKGVYFSQNGGSRGMVASIKVEKVVDTTAAGDTFVGYLAAEMARAKSQAQNFDVKAACQKANAAAAKCVTRSGAMQSIPFGYE